MQILNVFITFYTIILVFSRVNNWDIISSFIETFNLVQYYISRVSRVLRTYSSNSDSTRGEKIFDTPQMLYIFMIVKQLDLLIPSFSIHWLKLYKCIQSNKMRKLSIFVALYNNWIDFNLLNDEREVRFRWCTNYFLHYLKELHYVIIRSVLYATNFSGHTFINYWIFEIIKVDFL